VVSDLAGDTYVLQTRQQVAVGTSQTVTTHEPQSTFSQVSLDLLQNSHQRRRISANLQVLAEFLTNHTFKHQWWLRVHSADSFKTVIKQAKHHFQPAHHVEIFKWQLSDGLGVRLLARSHVVAVKPIQQGLDLINGVTFQAGDVLTSGISATVYLHQWIVLAVAKRKHLFRWALRQERCNDKINQSTFSQNVEHQKVAVADRTTTIFHFVHSSLYQPKLKSSYHKMCNLLSEVQTVHRQHQISTRTAALVKKNLSNSTTLHYRRLRDPLKNVWEIQWISSEKLPT